MRLLISGSWVRDPRWAQILFLNLLASSYLQKGEIKTSWNRACPSVIKINTQGRVYIHSEDQEAKQTLYLKYAGPVLRSKCNPGNETFVPPFLPILSLCPWWFFQQLVEGGFNTDGSWVIALMIYGYDLYSCVIPGDDQIENSCHTSGTEAHYRREPTWRRELRQTKPSRPLRLPTQWQNLIQMHVLDPHNTGTVFWCNYKSKTLRPQKIKF